ncbi:hypothetical protein LR48_Vigan03g073000 [Vigna angularis]|uniref:Uncharacterized protein n=1 Tax=Phaseolus angularis TaxID=3914 RepID=A0A0L9U4M2_PHAAN|nr:hypothetical protein LR48_Vigan03g073000 [Vigna angularis]
MKVRSLERSKVAFRVASFHLHGVVSGQFRLLLSCGMASSGDDCPPTKTRKDAKPRGKKKQKRIRRETFMRALEEQEFLIEELKRRVANLEAQLAEEKARRQNKDDVGQSVPRTEPSVNTDFVSPTDIDGNEQPLKTYVRVGSRRRYKGRALRTPYTGTVWERVVGDVMCVQGVWGDPSSVGGATSARDEKSNTGTQSGELGSPLAKKIGSALVQLGPFSKNGFFPTSWGHLPSPTTLYHQSNINTNFVSGNRLPRCCKRLPYPFLNTLTHPLQSLLLQLMRGDPTLLGLTSHHQPPSPTTETPGPALDSFVSGNRLPRCCKRLPYPFLNTLTHPLQSLLLQLMRGDPTLLGLTSHHQPPSPTTETPGPASDRCTTA